MACPPNAADYPFLASVHSDCSLDLGTAGDIWFEFYLTCHCDQLWYKYEVTKALNNTLQWDWICCGFHLIHNVVIAGLQH